MFVEILQAVVEWECCWNKNFNYNTVVKIAVKVQNNEGTKNEGVLNYCFFLELLYDKLIFSFFESNFDPDRRFCLKWEHAVFGETFW